MSPKGKWLKNERQAFVRLDGGGAIPYSDPNLTAGHLSMVLENNEAQVHYSQPATEEWALARIQSLKAEGKDTFVEEALFLKIFRKKPTLAALIAPEKPQEARQEVFTPPPDAQSQKPYVLVRVPGRQPVTRRCLADRTQLPIPT